MSEWKKATNFIKDLIKNEQVVCAICNECITIQQVDKAEVMMYNKSIPIRIEEEVLFIHCIEKCNSEYEDVLVLFNNSSVKTYEYTPYTAPLKP